MDREDEVQIRSFIYEEVRSSLSNFGKRMNELSPSNARALVEIEDKVLLVAGALIETNVALSKMQIANPLEAEEARAALDASRAKIADLLRTIETFGADFRNEVFTARDLGPLVERNRDG